MKDEKTGIYFFEKCLEISQVTSDKRGEMDANHNLGKVHESLNQLGEAASYHERHGEIAETMDITGD